MAFFLLSPLPMALLAFQFLGNAERTLTAKSIDSLTALSNKKVNEIDAYMSSKLRETRVLATGADTRNALRELAALRTTSATYASVLQTQRDLFHKLSEGAGVRNLLLVDDAGRVVFTLRPGVPLGTRLLASPYRETALAQGYRTALAQLDTQITRAQVLPGSDSEVAFFMVAPILDKGLAVGTIAVQLDLNILTMVATDNTGLGRTGETVLAREQNGEVLYTAGLRHIDDAAFQRRVRLDELDAPTRNAVQGMMGSGSTIDYAAKPVLAVWRYLPALGWGMVVKLDVAEAFADFYAVRQQLLIALGVLTMASGLTAFLLGRNMARAVHALTQASERVAQGALTERAPMQGPYELQVLSHSFNRMAAQLLQDQMVLEQRVTERTADLLASTRLFASVFERANAGICIVDANGIIEDCNDCMASMYGETRASMIGLPVNTFNRLAALHATPDIAAKRDEDLQRLRSGQVSTYRKERCFDTPSKKQLWVDVSVSARLGPNGEYAGLIAVMIEITQVKQAQLALAREQQRLRSILEGTQAGTWEWDIDSGRILLDERSASMVGMSAEVAASANLGTFMALAHPDDARKAGALFEQHLQGKIPVYACELRLRHTAGQWVWVLARGSVIKRGANGQPITMAGTHLDITENKAQDQQHEAVRAALDAHAIVTITDIGATISYANDKMCAISGYSREELMGQNHSITDSGVHSPEFFAEMVATVHAGKIWKGQICSRAKSGDLYWCEVTISPVFDNNNQPVEFVNVRYDITASKQFEASLEAAKIAAESANEAKSAFLANMSHEIRTPMNAILGLLNLLQSTELTGRQRDYAAKTEGAAQSLLGLLNDILDFSKVEAGKMTLESEPFRLDQMLRNLSVVLSSTVGSKPLEVLFDIDPALPPMLRGDAMRLQQVLINLGGNAVKFTSKGHVIVRLRSVPCATAETVAIEFAVQDTGIGIATEHQSKIFSGFSQAEASTTRRFGGTGLGLAISKRMVELMGGTIHITSVLGVGSTFSFTVTFPVVQPESGLTAPRRSSMIAPHRVLIVDDNPIAAELTLGMAQSWGWPADLALSGPEALELVKTAPPHPEGHFPYPLIFIDWQMPGMDGWEATRRLRDTAAAFPGPPPTIIMLTAHGRETLAQRSVQEQDLLSGFLVKPVTASMLLDATMEADAGNSGLRQMMRGRSSLRQLEGMRILVVEDNLINQQVADELLTAEGGIVSLAANGQLGVDAVAAAAPQFDVVLMDIQMPVLDGYGATRLIRHELGLTKLPIIAMTANAMASDREACLNAGMNEHIGKPFDMAKLVSLLIRATGLQSVLPTSNQPQGVESLDLLPAVEGLDWRTALARMSGMQALYARTARDFCKVLAAGPADLQDYLEAGDRGQAAMLLHTLKGNAGTLGAGQLAEQAAQMESLCKSADDLAECLRLLPKLAAAMKDAEKALQQATAQLAKPASSTANPIPSPSLKPLRVSALMSADSLRMEIATLDQMVKAGDLTALAFFDDHSPLWGGLPPAILAELHEALQALDLAKAHQKCHQLSVHLGS